MTFALIGSGNVASHLAPALVEAGVGCSAIYSPTYEHAEQLAKKVGAQAVHTLDEITAQEVDFVLLSIKDDALSEVIQAFPTDYRVPVLHTSGSTAMDVLARVPQYGVFYPLQTFSRTRPVDIREIPFFLEASDEKVMHLLDELTRRIGAKQVHKLTSEERRRLHLASVFCCNFVNHLYAVADDIVSEMDLGFEVLHPLLRETLAKALDNRPADVQTGPAIRGDQKTMAKHLELLSDHPKQQELYEKLSQSIYSLYHE